MQEQLGRDAAVASLETAIRLEPLDVDKRVRLIELLTERGQFDDATRAIDTMEAIAGDVPAAAQLREAIAAAATATSPEPILPDDDRE